jgi:hypothetical protein
MVITILESFYLMVAPNDPANVPAAESSLEGNPYKSETNRNAGDGPVDVSTEARFRESRHAEHVPSEAGYSVDEACENFG